MWSFYLKNKQPKPNTDIIVIIAVMLTNSTDAMLWCHLPIFYNLMCSQARDGGAERLRDGREGELDILKTLSDHCFLLQLLLFPLQCQSCVFVLIGSLWWKSCREPTPPSKLLFIGQESFSFEYGLKTCTNGFDWLRVNHQLNNAYVRSLYADQQAVSSDSQ